MDEAVHGSTVVRFPEDSVREVEAELRLLKRNFQKASRRQGRARLLRRLDQWAEVSALIGIGGVALFWVLYGALVIFSPWPPMLTLKHIAAAPNCDAARAVGLAPARRGEPGYYLKHDRDNDGIACEPWPRRYR